MTKRLIIIIIIKIFNKWKFVNEHINNIILVHSVSVYKSAKIILKKLKIASLTKKKIASVYYYCTQFDDRQWTSNIMDRM